MWHQNQFPPLYSCSIASSSGVSSSSGTVLKRSQGIPGPIDNSNLVAESVFKVPTLTGEGKTVYVLEIQSVPARILSPGGRLKKDTTLVQHRDFELVPDSLWKALALWYGGPLPLPRQVIRPPGSSDVELELYPINLHILKHQSSQVGPSATWSSVVGGFVSLSFHMFCHFLNIVFFNRYDIKNFFRRHSQ